MPTNKVAILLVLSYALINSVKSKGGTTEAALKVLEKNNKGLYNLMKSAINAANKRAQQLSKVT